MLAVARRNHPRLDFRPGDAEALPFADSSFDAVVGAFVLNHLPRPEVAAAELARVLASGGRLALSVWDVPERTRFIGLVRDAVAGADEAPWAGPLRPRRRYPWSVMGSRISANCVSAPSAV
jgi:ubiquinone/menaquinone biosynthesis C-methylase UbiE